MKTKAEIETRIRRIRQQIGRTDLTEAEEQKLSEELSASLARLREMPDDAARGPFSGLTRRELVLSGTCETDWV